MTEPRPQLLADVASQFENLEAPLNAAWANARGVTLEELQAVSQRCAVILRGYLALSPRDRVAFATHGIFNRPRNVDMEA